MVPATTSAEATRAGKRRPTPKYTYRGRSRFRPTACRAKQVRQVPTFRELREQREQIVACDPVRLAGFTEGDVRETTLLFLQREDPVFHRVLGDEAIDHDRTLLTDAVGAVGRL